MPCDYKNYPANWKTEIRPAILKRAENKCEVCGVPNYAIIYRENGNWKLAPEGMQAEAMLIDGVKFVKIVLTIAHLDHDSHNHSVSLDRLQAMCQKCHLNYDKVHHANNSRNTRNKKKKQLSIF